MGKRNLTQNIRRLGKKKEIYELYGEAIINVNKTEDTINAIASLLVHGVRKNTKTVDSSKRKKGGHRS